MNEWNISSTGLSNGTHPISLEETSLNPCRESLTSACATFAVLFTFGMIALVACLCCSVRYYIRRRRKQEKESIHLTTIVSKVKSMVSFPTSTTTKHHRLNQDDEEHGTEKKEMSSRVDPRTIANSMFGIAPPEQHDSAASIQGPSSVGLQSAYVHLSSPEEDTVFDGTKDYASQPLRISSQAHSDD